jgi:hypothetical protein
VTKAIVPCWVVSGIGVKIEFRSTPSTKQTRRILYRFCTQTRLVKNKRFTRVLLTTTMLPRHSIYSPFRIQGRQSQRTRWCVRGEVSCIFLSCRLISGKYVWNQSHLIAVPTVVHIQYPGRSLLRTVTSALEALLTDSTKHRHMHTTARYAVAPASSECCSTEIHTVFDCSHHS